MRRKDRPSKPNGLIKQTYSVSVHLPGMAPNRKWHAVAYFAVLCTILVFNLMVFWYDGITGRSPTSCYRKLCKFTKHKRTTWHILRQQDSPRKFKDGFLWWRRGARVAVPTLSSSFSVIRAPDYEYLTVYFTSASITSITGFPENVFAIATYLLSTRTIKPAAPTTVTFLRLFSVIIRGPPSFGSN